MANYCTVDDVSVLIYSESGKFDGSSKPTSTQVTGIITQKTAEIDLYLKRGGITTQPTDSTVLSYLKYMCSLGAACLIGRTYFTNLSNVNDTQPASYCQEYKDFLKELKEDPELIAGTTGDESYILGNQVTNGTVDEDDIPQIEDDFIV